MKKLCIVVPIFREKISGDEKLSLLSVKKNCGYADVFFVAPYSLDEGEYKKLLPKAEVKKFRNSFFKSVDSYSKMMMSYKFYEKFTDYEYMLIVQTDAALLKKIDENFDLFYNYDYIGAPWEKPVIATKICFKGVSIFLNFLCPRKCYIGNGGFSLRNIPSFIRLLKKKRVFTNIWNTGEDVFFAYHAQDSDVEFRIPTITIGRKFAVEKELIGKDLPYGIHAWNQLPPDVISNIMKNL